MEETYPVSAIVKSKYCEETMKGLPYEDEGFVLWVLLRQTRDGVLKLRERELNQYSITPEQSAVLTRVKAMGRRATPAEISRWLLREPHTISGLLSRMEKKGLVRKVKDLDRKNLIRVALTEKGQRAYHNATNNRESIHRIMSCLSEEDQKQLRSYLEKLRSATLKELGMEEPPFPPSE